ncbi:hypothetical protein [Serratia rubidaea]|uniref:hypothetical protein n=1 Tax=Serratia rubidaea TaxID=61652 RepID=UPI001BB0D39F|nr:hypothetical protein [Serratia rubidaea]
MTSQRTGEFVDYVVKQVIGTAERPEMSDNAKENITRERYSHEGLMRDAMRISQHRCQTSHAAENDDEEYFLCKRSNLREALTEALAPLESQLPQDKVQKLVMLMSVLYGTEAMTVLKDTFGMEQEEIVELSTWRAKLMLQQALRQEKCLNEGSRMIVNFSRDSIYCYRQK